MNPTFTGIQNQTQSSEKLNTLNKYFATFKVGTLLNRAGITKIKGATPLTIFTALFNLAFCNTNLYEGIVKNKENHIDKDAA